MIRNKFAVCLLPILCLAASSPAQKPFLDDYFRSPMDIPLYLSGNFGELRSNHFHAGIDFKTQGVIGQKIYAAAEGYISRLKIEAAGYGNTIYITHPEGYTTVYGHLDRFRDDVAGYVRDLQYTREQHALNIYPERDEWPVKKGEFIAWSGTSGYSFGPHLHFEIRDAAGQEPMNVLLFGFDIEDYVAPKMFSLYVYPRGDEGLVNNSWQKERFELVGDSGNYRLKPEDTLRLNGKIGFGLEAYDFLNGAHNRCGLYRIRMLVDGDLEYHWEMNQFSFSESRYINSYIDYEEKALHKKTVQKTFLDPNNKLGLYEFAERGGIVDFSEQREYTVEFILEDAYENHSQLKFSVQGGMKPIMMPDKETEDYIQESILFPNAYIVEGYPQDVMPKTFRETLGEQALDDLVIFLSAQDQ